MSAGVPVGVSAVRLAVGLEAASVTRSLKVADGASAVDSTATLERVWTSALLWVGDCMLRCGQREGG